MKNLNKLLTLLFIMMCSFVSLAQEAVKAQKDQYFPISSQSEEAKEAFREALDFLWNARTPEFIAKSDEAIRLDPQFFMAHANRAIAEATFENKGQSKEFIEKTLALPQENLTTAEQILRQIVVALKNDKPEEMKRQADLMIRTFPNSTQSYALAMAITRNFTENTDDMYGYAQKLLEINPNHASTWNQVGYYHLAKNDHAKAKEAFDNYLRLAPNEANAYDSMGDYYLAVNENDKAATSFDKAASMGMTTSKERADKARQLAGNTSNKPQDKAGMDKQQSDWDKQTADADKRASDIKRQDTDIKGQTADIKGQTADIDRQTAGIDQQTGMSQPNQFLPVSSTSQTAIKSYHDAIKRVDHADVKAYHDKLNQAVKEDPNFFMAQAHLAFSSVIDARNKENNKADKSKQSIETALAIPQQSLTPAEQIIREMLVSLKDNKTQEIKPLCDELVQQYPENVEAHMLATDISRFILDDNELAFSYCEKLLKVNPNVGTAWNLVGYYHIDKGNLQQAKAAFDNYIRLNPEEANAHDSMGDYYLAVKQYDQAAMHFEKAVAMGMDVSRERAEKARAMAQSGAGETEEDR
jgi:tetratricopeptide (TPR) repeat protein